MWWLIPVLLLIALLLALFIRTAAMKHKGVRLTKEIQPIDEKTQRDYAEKLAEMIRCKTVSNDVSRDVWEFQKLRDVIRELFPLLHEKADFQIFGDDCWVFRVPGKDTSRNIMLMSHHDVVKAEGEWEHPPFGGEIVDGSVWGRGAVDTKTPLFGELMAMEELLAEGFLPACNVYIASSHNEEIGGDGIPLALEYFKKQKITFELVLDEGGAIIDAPVPGVTCKCAMLAVHEKGRYTLNCVAKDNVGHAGLAAKVETPIVRLAAFITEVNREKPFITRLYPEVRGTFLGLAPYMSFPFRLIFSNLWLFWPLLKKLMPKINAQAGSMLGTQCFFTSISGGKKANVQTNEAMVTAFLRCVREDDLKEDLLALQKIAEKHGIELSPGEGNEYHAPADISRPAYAYVESCVHQVFPHVAAAPYLLPAGTDARHLVDVCPCVVRFAPITMNAQQFASVHSPNENIHVSVPADCVRFYKSIVSGYQ